MSDNTRDIRDTQFAVFANALYMECQNIHQGAVISGCVDTDQLVIRNIARRAYDLAFHSVDYGLDYLDECGIKTSGNMGKRIMPSIPDMTELP